MHIALNPPGLFEKARGRYLDEITIISGSDDILNPPDPHSLLFSSFIRDSDSISITTPNSFTISFSLTAALPLLLSKYPDTTATVI